MNQNTHDNSVPMRPAFVARHGLLKRPCLTGPCLKQPCLRRGFSLVEVLIAMGIFAVGFVAVAAMFPAGAILQRETVSQVEAQMVARNAAAIVRSGRLTLASSTGPFKDSADLLETSGSIDLTPFSSANFKNTAAKTRWKIGDRGYPTAQANITDRKYFWVPFIRKSKDKATSPSDWSVVVFVMRREPTQNFDFTGTPYPAPSGTIANPDDGIKVPKVVGVTATVTSPNKFNFNNKLFMQTTGGQPDQVRPGDFVADNNGMVYNVLDADSGGCTIVGGIPPTKSGGTIKLWYAPPPAPGATSPCVRILLLSGIVVDADS